MFNYSVRFSAVDNLTSTIDRLNRRLRTLGINSDRTADRMRGDFKRLDLTIGGLARTTRHTGDNMGRSLTKVNHHLDRVTRSAHQANAALSSMNVAQGVGAGRGISSRSSAASSSLFGAGMRGLATGGLSAFALYQPLKVAAEYETAFKDVRKSVEGTPEQFAKMRKEMLAFNGATFSDISKVASEAGKMGLNASNVMGFTSTVIKGATALDFDVNGAVNAIGKIMTMTNQMGNPTASASAIMNRAAHLENSLPGVKAGGILDIWGRSSSMFSQLGMNNDEMAGMAAFLEQNSVSSELGASSFITMMNRFKATNGKYSFFSRIKQKGIGGFSDVMAEISKLSGSDQQKIFGSDAMKLIGKMINPKTFGKLGKATSLASNSTGAVDKEWAIYRNTYDERAKDLGKTFKVLMASIGDPMKKMASDAIKAIVPVLKTITKWVNENRPLVVIILKIVATITALLVVFGTLAVVASGIGFAFSAITVAVGVLSSGFTILTGIFGVLMTVSSGFFTALYAFALANPITAIFVVGGALIIAYWDEITSAIEYAIDAVSTFMQAMDISGKFDSLVNGAKEFFGFSDSGTGINNNGSTDKVEVVLKADAGTSGSISGGRNRARLRTVTNNTSFGNAL